MKRFAIAALAGALTVPFSFAAQTATTQGSENPPAKTTKTKKHHAKKHTNKKAEKNTSSAVPPAK